VLADESAGSTMDCITGYQPILHKQTQVEPLAFSPASAVFDAGNSLWSMRFGVERVHADPAAAALFIGTHAAVFGNAVVRAQVDLQITIGATVLHMLACALTDLTPNPHSDQSTFFNYAFQGPSYA